MVKEIKLTRGFITLVDDEDFEYLNQWKWYAKNSRGIEYAYRHKTINGKLICIIMSRLIMGNPKNLTVDHKDGNSLNNQKSNLRICTQGQNACNRRKTVGRIPYKGVYLYNKKYMAKIEVKGKQICLGRF